MSTRNIHVKIPIERIGVLIGTDGCVKEAIERKLDVKIEVDSASGDVELISSGPDPSLLFRARDIVLAVGRGFSPEISFRLLNENLNLYVIDLRELFRSAADIRRVKSRVIGRGGKTRRIIEEETMTNISVYGHTISIIGDVVHIDVAKEAIEMLIKGVLHRDAYKFLDRKRNELRNIEMELWSSPSDILKKEKRRNV